MGLARDVLDLHRHRSVIEQQPALMQLAIDRHDPHVAISTAGDYFILSPTKLLMRCMVSYCLARRVSHNSIIMLSG